MNDKDQAAIDHVASVSKHPHAAIIVKQLITGWSVEFEYAIGEWQIIDYPRWAHDIKYRLIEPKPAKPAYRVYINKTTGATISRDSRDGHREDYLDNNHEWLCDWIEYDQPKEWPTPLVERIAAIDLEAAQWIVDHWDDLLEDRYTKDFNNNNVLYSRESHDLNAMFSWKSTGKLEYWLNIYRKLRE